jgi:branched-subunit amino acid aminotransferase/4-amino-4-deoxychorismate lyase
VSATELASVDGRLSAVAEATLPLKDDGLYRGDGAFEVIRLYAGQPFALGDHLDRLQRSGAAIELPVDRAALEREIEALLVEFGADDGQLRIVITRGGRRIAVTEPLPEPAETIRLATVTYAPSVILTGVKSLSYAANMQATRLAQAQGADEAVLVTPDGTVLEAPTATVFWVSPRGALRTPSLDSGVLQSITRARIVAQLDVEEGAWPVPDLRAAQEAFLASTTREVQAVSAIDGAQLPEPPGERTREAIAAFGAALERELHEEAGGVDFELDDEHRLISEAAREFADREIAPRARDNDRAARFDRELARKLGEIGYLGAPVAERYGGRALDYFGYGLIVEQVGRADSAARTVVSVQTSLVCGSIERWGTEEQKQAWLPRLCSGEALGCFGLTEPDTGSDAANLRTRATRTDGGWSISGQKMWISLGNYAELALIFAQTNPEQRHRGLACFLVPTSSDGFSTQEIHGKLGLRASDTAAISLDEVEIPGDALLGEVGDGFKVAMTALDSGRFSVAAGCVGICDGCVDASVAYAK